MHRSNFTIMYNLIKILGIKLVLIISLAVINGTIGYLLSISITILGSVGIAKLLGLVILIENKTLYILLISFGVLRGFLRYIEQYSNHYIAFKILGTLREKVFKNLAILSPAKLETKQKGSIISIIESDIETLEVFYAHTLSPIFIALVVSITLSLFIGFISNPILGILALINFFIIGYILPKYRIKKLNIIGKNHRDFLTKFNGSYMNYIKGSNNIILTGNQDTLSEKVHKTSSELQAYTNDLKTEASHNKSLIIFIIFFLNLVFLMFGLLLFKNGYFQIQHLIIIFVAQISSYGPVISLSALPNELNQTFASANHVLDLLAEEPLVKDINNKKNIDFKNLSIKNIKFSYSDNKLILDNFSLKIDKTEIIGILGPSGCGKSTLLKLILRFWDIDSGYITINKIPLNAINTKSLHKNVTLLSQSTYIFSDTIKNNLLIANNQASDTEIIKACKKASIHEFISSLKDGYNTTYSPKTIDFSSGEKQRIGLARAFLSEAKLILLDEPTSNVDSINEGIILKSIKDNFKDKAVIIVSHRFSTLAIADRIISMGE